MVSLVVHVDRGQGYGVGGMHLGYGISDITGMEDSVIGKGLFGMPMPMPMMMGGMILPCVPNISLNDCINKTSSTQADRESLKY